jgi:hypothetical protein
MEGMERGVWIWGKRRRRDAGAFMNGDRNDGVQKIEEVTARAAAFRTNFMRIVCGADTGDLGLEKGKGYAVS